MTKRTCYQCDEGLSLAEIQANRKAEILAYGQKVLADSEKALKREQGYPEPQPSETSDWDLLRQVIPSIQPDGSPVEVEHLEVDALALTEPQPDFADKVAESPKPYGQAHNPDAVTQTENVVTAPVEEEIPVAVEEEVEEVKVEEVPAEEEVKVEEVKEETPKAEPAKKTPAKKTTSK